MQAVRTRALPMAKQIDILCSEKTLYDAWNVVKAKGAAGGIDGVTIQEFEKEKRKEIPKLNEELKAGTWKPYPYLEIEIPKSKNSTEKRRLGMTAIRDKIVQQAIRAIIEPRYDEKNKKLIQQRKREFRKIESETSGLLVNKPGTFIGLTSRGITVSEKGKVIAYHHPDNLSQVVITGRGVSLSSNLVDFCLSRKIPIDFFDHHGTHLGSIINSRYMQNTLWNKQSKADAALRNHIALGIISGKIKNQLALVKYFNKYHKNHYPNLQTKLTLVEQEAESFRLWKKSSSATSDVFMPKLIGHESQMAIRYWDYIRELISDDEVEFVRREHQGAKDLVNSMLNYGYAILYVRVWQALLAAKLNPFDSIIHVRQEGKPTLVYDMVEIFRSQVVDRVVISLIQKGQDLEIRNGLLTDQTRQLLVKSVMERLARYEKYQGEEMKMEDIILRQAKLLAKAFVGTDKYKPYVAKW